jgi:hypothetical protein
MDGQTFPCHEHVVRDEDDDGEEIVLSMGPQCFGSLKALDRAGSSTQLQRIEERLGYRKEGDYDRGPDVWDLDVWPLVPMGETADTWDPEEAEEVETCNTVNEGCLAPAGFLGAGGGVVRGSEAADGRCTLCDEPLCSNCADDDGRCILCSEEEE